MLYLECEDQCGHRMYTYHMTVRFPRMYHILRTIFNRSHPQNCHTFYAYHTSSIHILLATQRSTCSEIVTPRQRMTVTAETKPTAP